MHIHPTTTSSRRFWLMRIYTCMCLTLTCLKILAPLNNLYGKIGQCTVNTKINILITHKYFVSMIK